MQVPNHTTCTVFRKIILKLNKLTWFLEVNYLSLCNFTYTVRFVPSPQVWDVSNLHQHAL